MTLEREIYSIETANINKETLEAMKNASNAMKQIHGGLTIDKVDQTMYVSGCGCDFSTKSVFANTFVFTGRNCASNTPSAKKSAKQSPNPSATKAWTRPSWTRNLRRCSKRSWTRRC